MYEPVFHRNEHLPALHALLKRHDAAYAAHVVECEGTFVGTGDRPSILDVVTAPRPAEAAESAVAA